MRVAASNWRDVEAALQAGATAILPVGATAKQHRLHLPMNADFLQVEWLARRLAELTPVVASPTVSYEHYLVFRDYPGSCSLSRGIFTTLRTKIINDIVAQAAMLTSQSTLASAPLCRCRWH
jgi:creatinine amidohydrolase/Fe(II)-dependent formamide hydrolase-like protein